MKFFYPVTFCFWLLIAQAISVAYAKDEGWQEKVVAESGQYLVKVQPKKVEVARVESGPGAPPHMRMRILRKNDRPLEIRLHTIERTQEPILYTGGIERWKDSYIGFELEFSFDRKTWKKLGDRVKKVLP